MPPRKSNVSQVSATGDESTPSKEKEREGISVEDLALPRTMVQRLAKGVLPANTQIQKDAITAMSKSATVFVNYLSNGANERALLSNRKTISPSNVLEALNDLEFEGFLPRVEAELRKFNEIQTGKRNEYRRKLKEGKDATGAEGKKGEGDSGVAAGGRREADMEEGDEGKLRGAKRMRRDSTDDLGVGPEGQLVERLKGKEAEVDGGGVRVDEGEEEDTVELENERDEEEDEEGDEDGDEEEQVSGDDEDNEDDEGEEGDTVDDMDRRLNALQAGLDSESSARSQADGGSADEDDTD